MSITIEFLQDEVKNLKFQREQALATASAALGAIQAYEALIAKLEAEKPADETPKKKGK